MKENVLLERPDVLRAMRAFATMVIHDDYPKFMNSKGAKEYDVEVGSNWLEDQLLVQRLVAKKKLDFHFLQAELPASRPKWRRLGVPWVTFPLFREAPSSVSYTATPNCNIDHSHYP